MTKWEYCKVVIASPPSESFASFLTRDGDGQQVIFQRDVKKNDRDQRHAAERFIGWLGEEGWELAGLVRPPAQFDDVVMWVFKRPMPD